MYERIKKVMVTHTFRQSVVTVISTFGSAGLGAVFYLLIARLIGSHEYGLFSISLTIASIAVTFADVGMSQGLVKFVARNASGNGYFPYAKLALVTKLGIGGLIGLGLWLLARPISELVLHQPEVGRLLPIVGITILGLLLFGFTVSVFQGLQRFWLWGGLQIAGNLVRLGLFGILFFTTRVDSLLAILLFASAPIAGFSLTWIWLPLSILKSKITSKHFYEFWSFNKWTAAFTITSTLASRLDTLLSARYLSLSDTGVYALATTMVAFLPQLSSAIGAVTAPKFASFNDNSTSQKYLGKAALFSLATSMAVALVMIPTALVVIRFTGRDFSASFTPFLILLLSLAIFTSLNPIRDSILYFYQKPQFFFWGNLTQAIVLVIAGLVLIPLYGVTGTALSALISHIYFGAICIWQYKILSDPK